MFLLEVVFIDASMGIDVYREKFKDMVIVVVGLFVRIRVYLVGGRGLGLCVFVRI